MDRASLELYLRMGLSLQEIGRRVGRDPSTVGYWVRKHGLKAVNRDRHAARGGLSRAELEPLLAAGLSIAGIGDRLDVHASTVKHWLRKHGLETARTGRLRAGREGKLDGKASVIMFCRKHGETEFWLEGRGAYRCKKCRWEAVMRSRIKARLTLIAEAGGHCLVCGYDAYTGALQFHHVDPAEKSFTIRTGATRSLDRMRAEAKKCVLLCANCHAEVEAGVTTLPSRNIESVSALPG